MRLGSEKRSPSAVVGQGQHLTMLKNIEGARTANMSAMEHIRRI